MIDTSVTDRVLAVKGGSGTYNVNGGNTAGESWANLKAHTHSMAHDHEHNHKWYNNTTNTTVDDETFDSSGDDLVFDTDYRGIQKLNENRAYITYSAGIENYPIGDSWTDNDNTASSATNSGAQSTSDVRPAAVVGTLQYPDV